MDEPRLYTIGHSTRSAEELVALLAQQHIALLVDVRSMPGSRRHPQFNSDALAESLAEAGIAYRHEKALGGRRKPQPDSENDGWKHPAFRAYADHLQGKEFQQALAVVLADAAERPTAVMCAEALPWRCHRWLIADAATVRGYQVTHIMGAGKTQPHKMTTFARVEGQRLTYPFALTSD
ncbi:MAG: DUF488 domain-containing protein [Salinisphaera sp.]|nr:DUF488 domain-containing protein [Salinisphaera sp.]